jgi:urease accessory protein
MSWSTLKLCATALVFVLVAFVPVGALAHPGVPGHIHGFANGLYHPLSGVDHNLAMVAVGLFAARLGGRAVWLVPLTFVSVMALAGIAGMVGVQLPLVELGIGMSVVSLGLAVAFQLSIPTLVAMAFAGFFAIFHGYAHGAEMSESVSGLSYGFLRDRAASRDWRLFGYSGR